LFTEGECENGMSLYLEQKYILLLSPKLRNFKRKGNDLFNFSCPYCGDSHKNNYKARGYFYKKKDQWKYHCHNCGNSKSFFLFLKENDHTLYMDYIREQYNRSKIEDYDFRFKPVRFDRIKEPEKATDFEINLPTISSLPENHYAKQFLIKRKIPSKVFGDLYFAKDFAEFALEVDPEKENLRENEDRIVIPFYNKQGILQGIQGRTLGNSKLKYITVKRGENSVKVYGWDKVDDTKRIYCVEGPLDSTLLQNSVASMDASLYNVVYTIGADKDYIFIFDNEPRNREINRHMKKALELGYPICVWPDYIKEKDINDMVLSGYTPSEVQNIIDKNAYSGLLGQLNMTRWSKI